MRANLASRIERRPEAQKRSEREGEQNPIGLTHARGAIHRLPALEQPLPALVRVGPTQRAARGRRGLVVARVPLDRLGQHRAPGRVGFLVGDELRLGGQGQRDKVLRQPQRANPDPGFVQLPRVEPVATVDRGKQLPETVALTRGERGAVVTFLRRDRNVSSHDWPSISVGSHLEASGNLRGDLDRLHRFIGPAPHTGDGQ